MSKKTRPSKICKNKILIVTNGDTEKVYFDCLRRYCNSSYNYNVQFQNADIKGLIECVQGICKSNSNNIHYNQIWCIFDIDESLKDNIAKDNFLKAITLARQKNIKLAISNECFEVFLLYHFQTKIEKNVKRCGNNSYEKLLSKYINCKFKKADAKQIEGKFIPKFEQAIKNAKQNYQVKCRDNIGNIENFCEWSQTTTVYQLIEFLCSKKTR